jgi:hypothetical protein
LKILPHLSTPSWIRSSFGFRNSIFLNRARSSALHPTPKLEVQVSVFVSPSDRLGQVYHQVPFSSPSKTCRAMVEVFYLTRLHTGHWHDYTSGKITWLHIHGSANTTTPCKITTCMLMLSALRRIMPLIYLPSFIGVFPIKQH